MKVDQSAARPNRRGYVGVGIEGVSKPMNLGALMRTAYAFEANFLFSIGAHQKVREVYKADTAKTAENLPYFEFRDLHEFMLPQKCQLVGIELTDDAVDLPIFVHPRSCAYVLGREKGSISPDLLDRCDHIVKIPTKFCINVSLAGALVLYDRHLYMRNSKRLDRSRLPG